MSRDSSYDQFLCRFWLTRSPLWDFLVTSTYNIFLLALERYSAVIYPHWYSNSNKVSTPSKIVRRRRKKEQEKQEQEIKQGQEKQDQEIKQGHEKQEQEQENEQKQKNKNKNENENVHSVGG